MQVSENEVVCVEEKYSSVTKTSVFDNSCSQAVAQGRKEFCSKTGIILLLGFVSNCSSWALSIAAEVYIFWMKARM
jgi:hypothetical protein